MSFEEKLTWVNTTTTVVVTLVYGWIIGSQVATTPVADINYQKPMLITVGAIVALTIVGAILMAIVTAIGAEITGEGSVDDIDRKDERDIDINRRGEVIGYYVVSAFMLVVLGITMLEYPHFWIANVMFAGFVAAGLTSAVVKLTAYRRGF